MTIKIRLDTYDEAVWPVTPETEYDFVGRFFVIKEKDTWVGMYAADRILSIEVR
ncbi:MAG: hypothetical protein J6S50_05755 [Oscillospiraceae bacterium]|nr:hypothetical protein [Lachnospiraceae bacterium]MBO7728000.1 hypothetical protein [Oscillospiraceae bacterium]